MKRLRTILLLSAVLIAGWVLPVCAQDTSSQQSRKERLEREIAIIDGQLRDNATRNSNALNTLSLVQQKIDLRRGLIKEGEEEISRLDGEIRRKQMRIDSLQVRLDTMTYYYNRLVKGAYKNRDARVWYMYILASENLAQGLRRYSFLKNLSKEMNSQGVKIKEAKSVLEGERISWPACGPRPRRSSRNAWPSWSGSGAKRSPRSRPSRSSRERRTNTRVSSVPSARKWRP